MVGKVDTERDICCLQMLHDTASHQHPEHKPFVFILLTGFFSPTKLKTRWLGSSNCSCMCLCMHLKVCMLLEVWCAQQVKIWKQNTNTCSFFCFVWVEGHGAAVWMISLLVWSVLELGAFDDSTVWVEWFLIYMQLCSFSFLNLRVCLFFLTVLVSTLSSLSLCLSPPFSVTMSLFRLLACFQCVWLLQCLLISRVLSHWVMPVN